jgi:hypothetical protein
LWYTIMVYEWIVYIIYGMYNIPSFKGNTSSMHCIISWCWKAYSSSHGCYLRKVNRTRARALRLTINIWHLDESCMHAQSIEAKDNQSTTCLSPSFDQPINTPSHYCHTYIHAHCCHTHTWIACLTHGTRTYRVTHSTCMRTPQQKMTDLSLMY